MNTRLLMLKFVIFLKMLNSVPHQLYFLIVFAFYILQYNIYKGNLTLIRSFLFDVMNLLNVVRYLPCKHVFPHRSLGTHHRRSFRQRRSWEGHSGLPSAVLGNSAGKDPQGKITYTVAKATSRISIFKIGYTYPSVVISTRSKIIKKP